LKKRRHDSIWENSGHEQAVWAEVYQERKWPVGVQLGLQRSRYSSGAPNKSHWSNVPPILNPSLSQTRPFSRLLITLRSRDSSVGNSDWLRGWTTKGSKFQSR
jgi:hypothetical protein